MSDNSQAASGAATEKLGFGDALQRLESILQQIDDESVSVDDLAKNLRQAKDLLEHCRSKIRQAEVEVGQIVQNLGDEG